MLIGVAAGVDGGGDDHHNGWRAVAHGVDISLPEATGAGVVEDVKVPDSEEEVQTLQEHPGEAGEEEVVEEARCDGTRQLDGGQHGHAWLPSVTTVWGPWRWWHLGYLEMFHTPNMASRNLKEVEILWVGRRLETPKCLFQAELSPNLFGSTHPEEEGTREH